MPDEEKDKVIEAGYVVKKVVIEPIIVKAPVVQEQQKIEKVAVEIPKKKTFAEKYLPWIVAGGSVILFLSIILRKKK